MTAPAASLPQWRRAPACHHWGHHPPTLAGVLAERDDMAYEYGRGAEMLLARTELGLSREEMAAVLRVKVTSYQRWENGRDAIPDGVWNDVDRLRSEFDDRVQKLAEEAAATAGPHIVRVWRGPSDTEPLPGMWLSIVAAARRISGNIVPRFPEDLE